MRLRADELKRQGHESHAKRLTWTFRQGARECIVGTSHYGKKIGTSKVSQAADFCIDSAEKVYLLRYGSVD